jgi:hypothetical protein
MAMIAAQVTVVLTFNAAGIDGTGELEGKQMANPGNAANGLTAKFENDD